MMFKVEFDHDRRVLKVKRSGLSELLEAERYEAEMTSQLGALRSQREPFDVLIDVSEGAVMPQQAVAPPVRVAQMLSDAGARRVAVVAASAIGKLQLRRLVGENAETKVFDTVDQAMSWITPDENSR